MTHRSTTTQDYAEQDTGRQSPAERQRQPACLFCQRDDSSINSIVEQSPNFYVRNDNFPATKGHVEIVPKQHVVSFFDLSPDEMREAHALMRQVQADLNRRYKPDGYTIGVNDGRAAGRTVDHLHIHLIPRYEGDVPDPRGGIRQSLPNYDPELWRTAE
jgi:diadenosine tetraphosphate (Ap4A) HIT family hydrolase